MAVYFQTYGAEQDIILKTPTGEIHGSLLTPENNPAKKVVGLIVCGSGPTDRNGNNPQMQNNSIKYLAEDLCKAGIASVRYDKRGIAASAAAAPAEKDLRFSTYTEDVKAWIEMLSKDYDEIIVIGHSEGALLATLAAIENPHVSALIVIAGTGRPADQVLKAQLSDQPAAITQAVTSIVDSLKSGFQVKDIPVVLTSLFRPSVQPYLISWFAIDPAQSIAQVHVPVLIVQGDKDIQVSTEDAEILHRANPRAKKIIIPNMNHVFKTCTTTDKAAQIPLYCNPDNKNIPELSTDIIDFINNLHKDSI